MNFNEKFVIDQKQPMSWKMKKIEVKRYYLTEWTEKKIMFSSIENKVALRMIKK